MTTETGTVLTPIEVTPAGGTPIDLRHSGAARRRRLPATVLATALATALSMTSMATPAGAQVGGELFPQPFVVEHHTVHLEADGTRYIGESVTDTYGGSWMVSERPDGSRLVLDLARREITEIRPGQGSYWRLSFTRLAELQARVERLDELPPAGGDDAAGPAEKSASEKSSLDGAEVQTLRVRDLAAAPAKRAAPGAPAALDARPGIQRFRVEPAVDTAFKSAGADGAADLGVDVWVDPRVRLTPRAREALSSFERDALRADRAVSGALAPLDVMKTIRDHAGGAFPVRVRRPVPGGVVEDVTTRLEEIERFDLGLVRVPEGLKRVAHPLESSLVFFEREAERRELMGGLPQ
ncbi:MAG: hypothetical protein AAGM22_05465 [Acidobacteriota bacterium]